MYNYMLPISLTPPSLFYKVPMDNQIHPLMCVSRGVRGIRVAMRGGQLHTGVAALRRSTALPRWHGRTRLSRQFIIMLIVQVCFQDCLKIHANKKDRFVLCGYVVPYPMAGIVSRKSLKYSSKGRLNRSYSSPNLKSYNHLQAFHNGSLKFLPIFVILGCRTDQFSCSTGMPRCVDARRRCDKATDCQDGSDEMGCGELLGAMIKCFGSRPSPDPTHENEQFSSQDLEQIRIRFLMKLQGCAEDVLYV